PCTCFCADVYASMLIPILGATRCVSTMLLLVAELLWNNNQCFYTLHYEWYQPCTCFCADVYASMLIPILSATRCVSTMLLLVATAYVPMIILCCISISQRNSKQIQNEVYARSYCGIVSFIFLYMPIKKYSEKFIYV